MTWHADTDMLAGYPTGTLDHAHAASLEAHLLSCAGCRAATTAVVSPGQLTAI